MTLTEFFEAAKQIGEKHGNKNISVHAMISTNSSNSARYSISLWVHEKKKFVESGQHNNPETALEKFKDAAELFFKQYDSTEKEIHLA